jgi:hypothetical protein
VTVREIRAWTGPVSGCRIIPRIDVDDLRHPILAPKGGSMGRLCWMCLLAILIVPALPGRASADAVQIEAEDYSASGDIGGCGLAIERHDCSGASGGLAVDGVDCAGEWIRLHAVLYRSMSFSFGLRSAGSIGYARSFGALILRDDGSETPVAGDTLITPQGAGVG